MSTAELQWAQPRQNCARGFKSLDPIEGLEFYPVEHRYKYLGQLVAFSVSKVKEGAATTNFFEETRRLPPDDPKRLNLEKACKRGDYIHAQLENFHLGKEVVNGEWGDWIDTCLAEPFWDRWEAVPGGVETNLIDTRYSISGKADLIIRHKETGEIAILDYKTQGRKTDKAYCVKTQLGGYISLADQCYPGLVGGRAFACFIRPGDCEIVPYQAADCIEKWEIARDLFMRVHAPF